MAYKKNANFLSATVNINECLFFWYISNHSTGLRDGLLAWHIEELEFKKYGSLKAFPPN